VQGSAEQCGENSLSMAYIHLLCAEQLEACLLRASLEAYRLFGCIEIHFSAAMTDIVKVFVLLLCLP